MSNEDLKTPDPSARAEKTVAREIFKARNELRSLLEEFVALTSDDSDHDLLEAFDAFARTAREYKC